MLPGMLVVLILLLLSVPATAEETKPAQHPWLDPGRNPPAPMTYETFSSAIAGQEVSFTLYLPPGYKASERRYPVVYWLHGLGGGPPGVAGFAARADAAIREGRIPPMLVVGVNGMRNSMYADSFDGTLPVESMIVKDLIPHIDATYRTIDDRGARAVEGFSMGGFGAITLGARYPERFGAVSSVAGALHDEDSLSGGGIPSDWSVAPERRKGIFDAIYGSKEYFRERSPWIWVETHADRIRNRTRMRLIVGDLDPVQGPSRRMHELLQRLDIVHDYVVISGAGHDPKALMDGMGERMLLFYKEAFGRFEDG